MCNKPMCNVVLLAYEHVLFIMSVIITFKNIKNKNSDKLILNFNQFKYGVFTTYEKIILTA